MSVREILAGRAVVELGLKSSIEAGLKGARAKLSRFSAGLSSVGQSFAGVGGAAIAGFGSVLGALAFPVKLAADMEMTRAGFMTLTKDAAKTDALMADIKKAAAATPFELPELAESAKKLLAFGSSAEGVVDEMMRIGDVAAGINAPIGEIAEIYGKARVQGTLFAEDINQLTGRGIPIIQELASQFGVAETEVKSLVSSGVVNFSHLEAAFSSMTTGSGTFAGGMERASKTIIGRWSTLKDTIADVIRPIGEALLPVLGALMDTISSLLEPVGRWIKDNSKLVIIIAGVAAAGVAAGAALLGIGTTMIAVGAFISAVVSIVGTLIAALSAFAYPVLVVLALAGAIYYFRDSIWAALAPLQPLFDGFATTIANFGSIFRQTFGGITEALGSGDLAAAGQIAMAGLTAAFWQGLSDLTTVFNTMLDMLESWLPGFDTIRDAATTTFASIGSALMAGRWDLAGAIIMAKLKLAIQTGWNNIKFIWTATTIGLMGIFESMGSSIRSTWRTMIFGLAKWILWLGEKLGLLDKGTGKMIEQMQAEAQTADDKALATREAARYAAAQEQLDRARASETDLKNQITSLEAEAGAAAANAPTLEERATSARAKLDRLTAPKPDEEKPLVDADKLDQLKAASANGQKAVGKLASTGTFSAAAAATMGIGTKPLEETARNTAALLSVAKKQLKQKPPAAVFE